ncbi:LysR family transcriptional regulator [Nocardia rhamnosiphila]|uniref:LysR family transcriptional regulator n=1 Tax=Nocardia rhamnosiphila TaxID=426716 RepID=UPI0004C42990|nr:LysR substrate-binding domain-containing protein [Nocardia rhamnosiphila]
MDLDLRKLRYFAALAEHLHFGRAAESLFIAQPVLSRQIRALEQELGCTLLERTTRSVQLTPSGAQLYEEARGLFTTVDSAVRRVREVDRGVERLVVGFASGLRVSPALRAFAESRPEVEVELFQLKWWERELPLRDGRADVGYLRRPFDGAGLRTVTVGTEPKVACLPVAHRLAGPPIADRPLREADLAGEPAIGAQVRRTASIEEKFELVASGHGIAVVPRGVARAYSRPDLIYRQVLDAAPVEICVAVPENRRERRVREFAQMAAAVLRKAWEEENIP